MKICIWVTKIFDLGGTKRVVTLLANELVKEHDVTIMTYEDRFREDRNMYHLSEDIKVDFIDNDMFVNRHHTPALCFRFLVKKLNERYGIFNKKCFNSLLAEAIFPKKTREKWVAYLNEQDYDIIITTAALSLRLGMLAPELSAKTIGWQHNCYDGYIHVPKVVFWKQECLLQEYLPKLGRYIVLSDYDKRDYKEKLGIDTEVKINPRSFVSEKKCDVSSKRFLMATRFVYAKGLDLMLDSFEEFCKEDDEWELDIIGAGDLFDSIVADAKKRGLDKRVHFIGYTNEPEKYYLGSSVFLLPSRWEGWPMVIMEAFEFGLPVIAYHMGAMDLIIDDEKTGFLPEAFDTHKFTQAMLKLAHDDELRKQMSANAIEKSGDFAIEHAVKDWNGLFSRLTQK
ncbi:glycosyltransferase [Ruminococcus sp. 5_1_39BFAA]|uniref:glycosyltransferase n=1 Tax=Ruminococcus sp. 5_1_39BFAA TaxID=457412 RepID=UPI0035690A35